MYSTHKNTATRITLKTLLASTHVCLPDASCHTCETIADDYLAYQDLSYRIAWLQILASQLTLRPG